MRPPDPATIPLPVHDYCTNHSIGRFIGAEQLHGGIISATRRLYSSSGTTLVLKTAANIPPDMYAKEAAGLQRLNLPGCPRVPRVLSVGGDHLLLEDLGSHPPSATWQRDFARQLATLHKHTSDSFGDEEDNYLGRLPQINTRSEDGVAFFVEHRLLRYLPEPLAEAAMTASDRRMVERFCEKFRKVIPPMPPALIHGDLWCANWLADEHGAPAYLDPAVYYGTAESELSFTRLFGGVDETFFEEYTRHYPLPDGWRERLPWYDAREWLAMTAHGGNIENCVDRLRELMRALV